MGSYWSTLEQEQEDHLVPDDTEDDFDCGSDDDIALDPAAWLKSKQADAAFTYHVRCVMNGDYDPISMHPKLSIVIFGYLKSLTNIIQIIPNDIELLCLEFVKYKKGEEEVIEITNNITNGYESRRTLNTTLGNYGDIVWTIVGDVSSAITLRNPTKNGIIILNVLGNFKGSVSCKFVKNLFIKCNYL